MTAYTIKSHKDDMCCLIGAWLTTKYEYILHLIEDIYKSCLNGIDKIQLVDRKIFLKFHKDTGTFQNIQYYISVRLSLVMTAMVLSLSNIFINVMGQIVV